MDKNIKYFKNNSYSVFTFSNATEEHLSKFSESISKQYNLKVYIENYKNWSRDIMDQSSSTVLSSKNWREKVENTFVIRIDPSHSTTKDMFIKIVLEFSEDYEVFIMQENINRFFKEYDKV